VTAPFGWTQTTLGQIATWGSGGTPTAGDPRYYGGDIPWAVIGDLNDGVITETQRQITDAGLRSSSAKLVSAEVVLLAMYGSIGKLGITGREMATNQAIAFARCRPGVLPKFLFYFLLSERRRLAEAGKGATQKNISQSVLRPWAFAYPNLDEQRRIVDLLEDHLSRLDAANASLDAAKRRLQSMQTAAVRRELTAADVGGPRPNELVRADSDDGDLPALPEGWAWARLGDLADVVGGVTKDAKKQSAPDAVEVPYLRVANVQRGRLDLREVTHIRVPQAKAAALRLLPGDVLLNEGGDRDKLGRGWVWQGEIDDCIHQNHVFRARIRNEAIDPFLLSWAGNYIGGAWCERNGRQSVNLASISLSKIRLMPVPVPPRSEQAAIRARVETVLESAARLDAVLRASEQRSAVLRRALLEAVFSGRLTGRSSNPEVVEDLAAEGASG
jgi:type I restriction enzyme S subunit